MPTSGPIPWQRWFVTLGGAGMLPKAPGTWGSLLTCILLWPCLALAGPSMAHQTIVLLAGLVLSSALCVAFSPFAVADYGRRDPGPMVLDEAAGICLTLLFLPAASGGRLYLHLLLAFGAFRVFDVTKPPPARQLERLPAGWGILCDDLAAAVYANLVCQVVMRLV